MVLSSSQQQKTLGFLKPDVSNQTIELLALIKSNNNWKMTFDKELHITFDQAMVLYNNKSEQDAIWISSGPIHVFLLEGINVIKQWSEFVGPKDPGKAKKIAPQSLRATYGLDLVRNVCHASGSEKEAQHDLVWLKSLVTGNLSTLSKTINTETQNKTSTKSFRNKKSTTIPATLKTTTTTPPSSSSSSSSSPSQSSKTTTSSSKNTPVSISRKHQSKTNTPVTMPETKKRTPLAKQKLMTNQRSKPSPPGLSSSVTTTTLNSGSKPISPPNYVTTAMESKNNKRVSSNKRTSKTAAAILDQKQSKLEKQKGAVVPTIPFITKASEKAQQLLDEKDIKVELENKDTITQIEMSSPEMNLLDEQDTHTPRTTESIDTLSSTSTSSSKNTGNSYFDDEVAAAAAATTTTTTTTIAQSKTETVKSSTTPDLIESSTYLTTRSKSPEVGNLRQRFEHLAQTRSTTTTTTTTTSASASRTTTATATSIKRTSSFTPEIAYRIKDLKPKDPTGSRVKSMVEFFMDENLHKWEF